MKREINMHTTSHDNKDKMKEQERIDTDPFGSWTGTPTDNPFDKPVQDVDDL